MIKLDGMLMIGSAETKSGKTELACALLRKFNKNNNIMGIKVTTIENIKEGGLCSEEGRDTAFTLKQKFVITEENNETSGKDTARLLAAGASRVFWLRALKGSLGDGLATLLDRIRPEAVSICESNSLRQIVEPGLFLIVKRHTSNIWKDSAKRVKKYADRIVTTKAGNFDIDLNRIKLINNQWILQEKATAIILAGGTSRRMGADKSMLIINGLPVIEIICKQLYNCFEQIMISATNIDKFAFLGFDIVPDKVPEKGPLMGISSALEASANELNFIVACDTPYVELRWVRRMLCEAKKSKVDIVVPITKDRRRQSLFAIYRKNALTAIEKVLSTGSYKVSDVLELCKVKYIELETNFANLNTKIEYEKFKKRYSDYVR